MLIFDFKEIGNRLYSVRKNSGKTQADVAELAGISDRTYADIERGTVNMRIETLQRICNVLNITPDVILTKSHELTKQSIIEKFDAVSPAKLKGIIEIIDAYIRNT